MADELDQSTQQEQTQVQEDSAHSEEDIVNASEDTAKSISDMTKSTAKIASFLGALSHKSKEGSSSGKKSFRQSFSANNGPIKHFKNAGLVLFILSTFFFTLSKFFGYTSVYTYFSLLLMLYTAIVVFEGRGSWLVIIALVWYFNWGSADIATLQYALLPIIGIALLFHGLINHFVHDRKFAEGFGADIGVGVMIILIFVIDIGLADFFVNAYGIQLSAIFSFFLRWVPLWAYVGFFVMMGSSEEKTALTGIAKFIGVIYLIGIFFLIPGQIDSAQSLLPDLDEAAAAKSQAEEQFSSCQSPFARGKFWWGCSTGSSPGNSQECINDKVNRCDANVYCEKVQKYTPGTPRYVDCVQQEIADISGKNSYVAGTADPNIKEPTSIQLKIEDKKFPQLGSSVLNYPIDVIVLNPRREKIDGQITCGFTSTSQNNYFPGTIQGSNKIELTNKKKTFPFTCEPIDDIVDGNYYIQFNVTINNLETVSRLLRAFVADDKDYLESIAKEIKTVIPDARSKAPADLARLNFHIGYSNDDPIIYGFSPQNIALEPMVENLGKGRLLKVHGYFIDITGLSIIDGDKRCIHNTNIYLPRGIRTFYGETHSLPNCVLEVVDPVLLPESTDNWQLREFQATINYDYELSAKKSIRIKRSEQ